MIKEHRRTFKVLRLGADLGLLLLLYYALYFLTTRLANPLGLVLEHPDYRWHLPLAFAICWAVAFLASGAYDKTRETTPWRALVLSCQVVALMLVVFALGLFAFKIQFLSRKFVAIYAGCSVLLLALTKSWEMALLKGLRRTGFNTRSILLVGEGAQLSQAAAFVSAHAEWGYRLAGTLSLKASAAQRGGQRPLGSLRDLPEVLRTRIVDEVFFAAPPQRFAELHKALEACAESGVQVRAFLDERLGPWHAQLDRLEGRLVLALAAQPKHPYTMMVKELADRFLALLLLLLLSPILALTALGILLTMGGPVLFLQKRAGQNGRAFFLYKFRTMVTDARAQQAALEGKNVMGGPVFKVKDDPRITPLGRFLRRTSLDELPQLFNVLLGEISLVGPRPMAMYEARKVPAWARARWSVKPGITCYWQVMGRNRIGFDDWMRLDLRYVEEWSLWLDLWLLLRTVPAVLFSQGAY